MNYLIILAAGLLPAAVLFVYILRKDPQPEPASWLRKAFFYGVAICFPVALVEGAISAVLFGNVTEATNLVETTLDAFFVAALPEESFKLLALWLILRRNPYFDEHFDGIVYAVCVGLGFASLENIGYLFSVGDEWQTVAIGRALLAVPGHYAFAVLMGYYYSMYHFVDRSSRTAACVLLVPVLAHGVYDTLAMSGIVSEVVGGVSMLILIFFCIRMHKFARKKIMAQLERDRDGRPLRNA